MPTYVSADGLQKMKEEMELRRNVTRREIAERILSAKELGDLSENFEYQEAKEQQAMNEARVQELEGMIKDYVIVPQTLGTSTINLGATFVVGHDGKRRTFEMVGSNEADPIAGKISNESPIGKAFIGHGVGEDIEVDVPSGKIVYKILEIK